FEPALLSAAWDWIYRLRQDDLSQEALTEWSTWYDADPRHRAAFDDMQDFVQQMDRVTEGPDALSPELWLGELAAPRAPAPQPPLRRFQAWRPGRRRWAMGVAAGAALAAVLLWPLAGPDKARPFGGGTPPAIYTAADRSSEARLADGSHVELAAHTSLAVEIGERQRKITMQEGVAYFTVAKDASKPFVVYVGGYRVRAVGTAFNIRSAGKRMVVTVAEGTVDVYPEGSEKHSAVRAHAGAEVVWAAQASGPVVSPVDPANALGWKQGRLDYVNEPLSSVVADLNRYSGRRILIGDPEVGEISVTGSVRANAVQAWVEALPGLFPVRLSMDAEGNLLLSHAESL
ncbi:MAG TPA: FecR domain-containing protein, partial [Solimonas sp.]